MTFNRTVVPALVRGGAPRVKNGNRSRKAGCLTEETSTGIFAFPGHLARGTDGRILRSVFRLSVNDGSRVIHKTDGDCRSGDRERPSVLRDRSRPFLRAERERSQPRKALSDAMAFKIQWR